ncbi:hypothetical protein SpCBS45565_g03800 [Spizellomyces sp. 'palustris']|nr:hypothetical protein SpCBS45565_g03800 [Spizellomyces sp. 'palustris']
MEAELSFCSAADDELFRSFLNEDVLEAQEPQDLGSDQTENCAENSVKYLSAACLTSPKSPRSDICGFTPSSPSSASSVASPTPNWRLDFDEAQLANLLSPPPLLQEFAPCLKSPESLVDIPIPTVTGYDNSVSWKFVNCSVPGEQKVEKEEHETQPLVRIKTDEVEAKPIAVGPLILPKLTGPKPGNNHQNGPARTAFHQPSPLATTFPDLNPHLTPADKRTQRLIKNRAAALESRKRKREQQQMLETYAEQLSKENAELKAKIADLGMRNKVLTEENMNLRGKLSNLCARCSDFEGGVLSRRILESMGPFEDGGRKAIGAVFMAFFFSFALILIPGFLSPSAHFGGHITGKVFSDVASVPSNSKGIHLLEAAPSVLYLPPSAPAAIVRSESGLVPLSHIPVAPRVESSVSLPLNHRFADLLGMLSAELGLSKRSRSELAKLHALFREEGAVAKVSRRKHTLGRAVGKRLLMESSAYVDDESSTQQFLHVPADHGVEYGADGKDGHAVPFINVSDLIHLLPYRKPVESPVTEGHTSSGEEENAPRFSLITTLSSEVGEEGGEAAPTLKGGFLQLDLEVINARFVKWNGSEI